MISIDSDGIDNLAILRSEVCRIPKKDNPNGLIQIMNKKDMKSNKIDSPNEGDCIMMSLFKPPIKKARKKLNYGASNVV